MPIPSPLASKPSVSRAEGSTPASELTWQAQSQALVCWLRSKEAICPGIAETPVPARPACPAGARPVRAISTARPTPKTGRVTHADRRESMTTHAFTKSLQDADAAALEESLAKDVVFHSPALVTGRDEWKG